MSRGIALLLLLCTVLSVLTFAQSDSLLRRNNIFRPGLSVDSFENNIINSRQSDTMHRGIPGRADGKR